MLGSEIHNLVKIKLEEYSPYNPTTDGPLLQGGDLYDEVKPIGAYIKAHLAEAANEMLLITPVSNVNGKVSTLTATEDDDDPFIGTVNTPSDYLKIHTFKMTCWKKAVHMAYKAGDYMDSRQTYIATRGHIYKPILIEERIATTSTTNPYLTRLRYYSTDGDNSIQTYMYVPMFSDSQEYMDRVAELIALNCAKKVCEVFERTDALAIINNEMQSVLQALAS